MDDLITLVGTYRVAKDLDEKFRLSEDIFRQIEPELHLFVFSSVPRQSAEDVLQEVLKAVATSLKNFEGNTVKEFWGWCYRIARNKINDQFRSQSSERMHPLPPEELLSLLDASTKDTPISVGDRHDLEYAMKLLTDSKPECYEFLWKHYVFGLAYGEIADELNLSYDNVRMKIGRCLETAQNLVA
jgi:RNA polymerase sigma factor (sigma-70 family)